MKPPPLSLHPVVEWLVHGARNPPLSQEVLTELCQRMTAAGVPLWRVTVFVRTLHPQIVGRRFIWHPGTGTPVTDGSFRLLEPPALSGKPDDACGQYRRGIPAPPCRSGLRDGLPGTTRFAR